MIVLAIALCVENGVAIPLQLDERGLLSSPAMKPPKPIQPKPAPASDTSTARAASITANDPVVLPLASHAAASTTTIDQIQHDRLLGENRLRRYQVETYSCR